MHPNELNSGIMYHKYKKKRHDKYNIWTDKPNYIIKFSADNRWTKDHHIVKVKARNEIIAIKRASEIIKFTDKDAIFVSCKKYYTKNKKYKGLKKKLKLELKKENID